MLRDMPGRSAGQGIKNISAIVMAALQHDGCALELAGQVMKNDAAIVNRDGQVMAAVQQNCSRMGIARLAGDEK